VGSISNSELYSHLPINTTFFITTISQVYIHNIADKANFPSRSKSSTDVDKSKPSEPAKKKVTEPEPSKISELITDSDSEEKAGYEEADTKPL
jgi:hypothetical protein